MHRVVLSLVLAVATLFVAVPAQADEDIPAANDTGPQVVQALMPAAPETSSVEPAAGIETPPQLNDAAAVDEPQAPSRVVTTDDRAETSKDAEAPAAAEKAAAAAGPNFIETSHTIQRCGAVTITLRNVSPWIYPVSFSTDGSTPNGSGPKYGPIVDNRTDGGLKGPQQDRSGSRTITFAEDEGGGTKTVKYVVNAGSESNLWRGKPVGTVTTVVVNTDCKANVETVPFPEQEVNDPCGLDNATWVKPEDSASVKWTITDDGRLIGETQPGYVWPNGTTVNSWGVAQDSGAPCTVPFPEQEVNDPCGLDNATWVKPEDSASVKWTITDDGRLIGETQPGYVWPNGTTVNSWGVAQDSGDLCPLVETSANASVTQATCDAPGAITLTGDNVTFVTEPNLGSSDPREAGTYAATANGQADGSPFYGDVVVTATAQDGYVLAGDSEFTLTLVKPDCDPPVVDVCPDLDGNQPEGTDCTEIVPPVEVPPVDQSPADEADDGSDDEVASAGEVASDEAVAGKSKTQLQSADRAQLPGTGAPSPVWLLLGALLLAAGGVVIRRRA